MQFDVAVIGGGAAGLCAAAALSRRDPNIRILLLEQLPRVGKKLITTGNGRCNITNREIADDRYHSEDPAFLNTVLSAYDRVLTEQFFAELGIVFTFDETGRAYPYSLQASSVVDALRFALAQKNTAIKTDTKVTDLKPLSDGWRISTSAETYTATAVLIVAGLYAGGSPVGSDGSVFEILRKMGYPTVKTTPAIVQLRTPPESVRPLKGIKVNADATLYCGGSPVRREFGEVLFCDYGLSGPPILQISREAERRTGEKYVTLDLMPEYSREQVFRLLRFRVSTLYRRNMDEFLSGMLNKRVGQTLIKSAGFRADDPVGRLQNGDLDRLAERIKAWRFEVTGTTGFLHAQVTAGGLDTASFSPDTMMSRRHRGLFAAGEILDVDGDCGGFNLQWAWSSALCAADGILLYLGEQL